MPRPDTQSYRDAGWWRDTTFLDDLRRSAAEQPDRTAVHVGRDGHVTTLDYAELARLTERCAGALIELGVERGDVVAIGLVNRWEMAPLFLACARVGATICTMQVQHRRQTLELLLGMTQPRVAIVQEQVAEFALADTVADIGRDVTSIEHIVVADATPGGERRTLEEWMLGTPWEERRAADLDDGGTRELGPDDPYVLFFTSGTTGDPKGAIHSQNTLFAAIRGEADVYGLDRDTNMCTVAVNMHYTGFVQGMLMPVMLGGTMTFRELPEADGVLDEMAASGVTTFYTVPYVIRNMLDEQRRKPRELPALSTMISGSAPIPPHLIEEVEEIFGLRLYSLWGMTENGPVTMSRPDDPSDWAAHSDGSPISGMELRIDPIPGSDDGKLWVRGPTQCLGYFARPEVYDALLDEDGWFDTNDLARDDGRGGIRITGRAEDTILRHGYAAPIQLLESTLEAHPKIRRGVVVGLPEHGGVDEVVCAIVEPREPVTLDEVVAAVQAVGISQLYWPTRLEVVEELPVTTTGKIRKVELKDRYALG